MPSEQRGKNLGFTLIEALMVLALLGTLLGLAVPSLNGLRQRQQMRGQGERLLGSLMLARTEALRRHQRVTLCVRGTDATCSPDGSWAQGWLMYGDINDNGLFDADDPVLQVQEPLPAFLRLTGNAMVRRAISYGPEGRSQTASGAFQAGTLTLCQPGQVGIWRVVINAVGKPRLEPAHQAAEAAGDC